MPAVSAPASTKRKIAPLATVKNTGGKKVCMVEIPYSAENSEAVQAVQKKGRKERALYRRTTKSIWEA